MDDDNISGDIPVSTNPFDDLEDEEEEEQIIREEEIDGNNQTISTNPFALPLSSPGINLIDEHWRDLSDLMDTPITNPFALQEFKDHLSSIVEIMEKEQLRSDCYSTGGHTSECLELLLSENMLEKIYLFTNRQRSYTTDVRIALLGFLKNLLSLPNSPPLFIHQQVLRPLNRLLRICEMSREDKLTLALLPLLQRICELIQENESFLDLFFTDGAGHVPSKFFIFTRLVPYLHDGSEGGTRARDAILLCLSVAGRSPNSTLCDFIVADTDFCHVLATGLSALYSSLPTQVELFTDDWSSPLIQLQQSIAPSDQMKAFMQALTYCNSVLQMAPLLVCQAVTSMIKNGFLQQVMGPAILQPSPEEATVAIGYFCLFLSNITNVQLLRIFLQFIILGHVDGKPVCNMLIQNISSESNTLSSMTLELFYILIDLNCEDILLHLVLSHLLPGPHITSNQLASINKRDLYCVGARRLLELIPQCCIKAEELYLESLLKESNSGNSSRPSSPPSLPLLSSSLSNEASPLRVDSPLFPLNEASNLRGSLSSVCSNSTSSSLQASSNPFSPKIEPPEVVLFEYISPQRSYYNYLVESQAAISECAQSCQVWSSCYTDCLCGDERRRPTEATSSNATPTLTNVTPTLTNENNNSLSITVPTLHDSSLVESSALKSPPTSERSTLETLPINLLNESSAHKGSRLSPRTSPRGVRRNISERFNDEVGLFLKVLMERLSMLLSNTPLINELLMKLISRLAHYPHPLIRSFLLPHNLILKPGIPNLLHVLQDLKQTIDKLAKERDTFPSRLGRARKTLIFQTAITTGVIDETTANKIATQLRTRSDSHLSDSTTHETATTPTKDDNEGSQTRRRRAMTEGSKNLSEIRKRIKKKQKVTINMVYAIVMYGEWLKELASLAQEHSIINPDLLQLKDDR